VSPSAAQNEKRYTDWLRDYRGILLKVARSFAAVAADQDELFQEMMLQLWRSLPRFQAQAKPSTWVYRVCLNTAQTWRRTEQRRQYLAGPLPSESASDAPSPGVAHEQAETLAALYTAVRALPPADRALVLLLLDGQSYREISEITGLTENHVGVALTRARKKLAEAMKEVRHEL
jgi:RNA polymerase sigma-70 factor (ECF subfamily)